MFLHIYILPFIPALWAVQSVKIYRKVFRDKRVSDQIFFRRFEEVSPLENLRPRRSKNSKWPNIFPPLEQSGSAAQSQKNICGCYILSLIGVMLHVYQVLIDCCKRTASPPMSYSPFSNFCIFFPSPNHLSLLLIVKRQTTRMLGIIPIMG